MEPGNARPFGIKNFGQFRVKGEAAEKAFFLGGALLGGLLVEGGDAFQASNDVLAEGFAVLDGFRGEEAAAQDFGHVLFDNRLDNGFAGAAKDVVILVLELAAKIIIFLRVAGQE